jgi:hypothetical protein
MMSRIALVGLLVFGVAMAGCAQMMVSGADVKGGTVTFKAQATTSIQKEDDPMAMVEAQTAAAAMAKANLLEKIKGAEIMSHTQVKDLAFAAQETMVRAEGTLARVDVTYLPMERTGPNARTVTAVATLTMTTEQYEKMMWRPKKEK